MGSDEPLWVGFLHFKDDAPADVRDGFGPGPGPGGIQISSADTKGRVAAVRAYQDQCRNTIPAVPPSDLDECLAIAALMETERALSTLTVKDAPIAQTHPLNQEAPPPTKKRRGPVPPPLYVPKTAAATPQ
jgi:hypothetical protein